MQRPPGMPPMMPKQTPPAWWKEGGPRPGARSVSAKPMPKRSRPPRADSSPNFLFGPLNHDSDEERSSDTEAFLQSEAAHSSCNQSDSEAPSTQVSELEEEVGRLKKLDVWPRPAPKYLPKWSVHHRFPPQNEAKSVPKWASPILEQFWLRFGVEIDAGRAMLEGILGPAEAKHRA